MKDGCGAMVKLFLLMFLISKKYCVSYESLLSYLHQLIASGRFFTVKVSENTFLKNLQLFSHKQ